MPAEFTVVATQTVLSLPGFSLRQQCTPTLGKLGKIVGMDEFQEAEVKQFLKAEAE